MLLLRNGLANSNGEVGNNLRVHTGGGVCARFEQVIDLWQGVTQGYHNLTHHGKSPDKIDELVLIEMEQIKAFRDFLAKLHSTGDGAGTLLDQTMVLLGSGLASMSGFGLVRRRRGKDVQNG